MRARSILIVCLFLSFLLSANFVAATNGCGLGDPECGPFPTNNCDVTQDTIFSQGTYNLPQGIDICANDITLDCNGASITGSSGQGITLNTIANSTVKNCKVSGYFSKGGVYLSKSNNNTISNNYLNSNYPASIYLWPNAHANAISNNVVTGGNGISMVASQNNTMINNSISGTGLSLDISSSGGGVFYNNSLNATAYSHSLSLTGNSFQEFNMVMDTSNKIRENPIYYLVSASNYTIDQSSNAGFFACIRCNNVSVSGINLSGNSHGVLLFETNNSKIANITASSNTYGIWLLSSHGNTVDNSLLSSNTWAVHLTSSDRNAFTSNKITASGSGNEAILLTSSRFNTIADNSVTNNRGNGILLSKADNNTVAKNNVSANSLATPSRDFGIKVSGSSFNTIADNIVDQNANGILLASGFGLPTVVGNIMRNNTVTANRYSGIELSFGTINSSVVGNTIKNNLYGLRLIGAAYVVLPNSPNNLSQNTMTGNQYNFYISNGFEQIIDTSNTVNGRPIYFLRNITDATFDASTNAGYFACISCNNVSISGLSLSNNSQGILLSNSNNSVIDAVNSFNNQDGFLIEYSSDMVISNSVALANKDGFYVYGSNNATLVNNTALNNSDGFLIGYSSNQIMLVNNTAVDNSRGFSIGIYANAIVLKQNKAVNNGFSGFGVDASLSSLSDNTATNNSYGLYVGYYANGNVIQNNQFCFNNKYSYSIDLRNEAQSPTNTGVSNTCDITKNWNDTGVVGCTFQCSYANFTIITPSLPTATIGVPYTVQLRAAGGTPPYSWSIAAGLLPPGISLSTTGSLAGTPSQAGNFMPTIAVADSLNATVTKQFGLPVTITLPPPKTIVYKAGTTPVAGRTSNYFIAVTNVDTFPTPPDFAVTEQLSTPIFSYLQASPSASATIADGDNETLLITWNVNLAPGQTSLLSYTASLNPTTPGGTTVIGGPALAGVAGTTGGLCSSSPPPGASGNVFQYSPLPGSISSLQVCPPDPVSGPGGGGYLCRSGGGHNGVDLKAQPGTPVSAIDGGTVEFANWQNASNQNQGCGMHVRVRHANGCTSTYCHLSQFNVSQGSQVTGGQILGLSGTTGNAYNAVCHHLHFIYKCPVNVGSFIMKYADPCPGLNNPEGNAKGCSCQPSCAEDVQPVLAPRDPNEKVSLGGSYIQSNQSLLYAVHFENIGNTSALDIFITDDLEQNLDTATTKVADKNGTFLPISNGQTITLFHQLKNKTVGGGNITVNITVNETWTATLQSRTLQWNLTGVDLPVNATDNVLFSINPLQNLLSGTQLRNNATIQFEIFESLTTNDTINIIDDSAPNCTMNPLPPMINTTSFAMTWSGTDAVGNISTYTILASEDQGGFNQIINATPLKSATVTAKQGTYYEFICIATDTAGNTEVQTPVAEATTYVNEATIAIQGTPQVGQPFNLTIADHNNPGLPYFLFMGFSGTSPGIPLPDGRVIPVNFDSFITTVIFQGNLLGFSNQVGFLDANGNATITWNVPNIPILSQIPFYASCITVNTTLPFPQSVRSICDPPVTINIQP